MSLEETEDKLDELQLEYIAEDDDIMQLEIERKFSFFLHQATKLDQIERIAAGVTINNWTRETPSKKDR